MIRTHLRSLRSVSAIGVVAAIAAIGISTPASAAVIDAGRLGSITIHRFETPPVPTGLPADGGPIDTAGLVPVAGVEYAIRRVLGIDLAAPTGWTLAQTASSAFDPSDPTASLLGVPGVSGLGAPIMLMTDADGVAASGPLPLGLYLVTEGALPPAVMPAAPVVVSVPLTDPDTDDWRYDVHLYPKSDVLGVAKAIDDFDVVTIGDEVVYTITSDIPADPPIDGYRIEDPLDPRLGVVDTEVAITDGTAIVEGADYVTTLDATNLLTVDFTAAGRAALVGAGGAAVEVQVTATIGAGGMIENQARLELDSAVYQGSLLSPIAELRLGSATIRKVDGSGAALAGAAFAVYRSESDAIADEDRIELDGDTIFTSDATGELVLDGLRFSRLAGGAAVAPGQPGYRSYWLSEVATPEGYTPLGAPIEFEVSAATTTGALVVEVENLLLPPIGDPPDLAFTGLALGGALLGGTLLIGGGIGFILVPLLRRRHGTQAPR